MYDFQHDLEAVLHTRAMASLMERLPVYIVVEVPVPGTAANASAPDCFLRDPLSRSDGMRAGAALMPLLRSPPEEPCVETELAPRAGCDPTHTPWTRRPPRMPTSEPAWSVCVRGRGQRVDEAEKVRAANAVLHRRRAEALRSLRRSCSAVCTQRAFRHFLVMRAVVAARASNRTAAQACCRTAYAASARSLCIRSAARPVTVVSTAISDEALLDMACRQAAFEREEAMQRVLTGAESVIKRLRVND